MNQPFTARIGDRFSCAIDVAACDTLNNHPARIVDLSQHGAQVQCEAQFEAGKTIHIDLGGEYTWATVAWSEVDRMGVKFMQPLNKGTALGRELDRLLERRRAPAQPAVRQSGFGRRQHAA